MPSARKSRGNKKKNKGEPLIRLSPAAKLEILGASLLMLAIVTLLSLLSLSRSQVTEAWLAFLARTFGWGRLAIPFGLGGIGVLLFLTGIDHPVTLHWPRVLGLTLLFLSAEGLLHSLSFPLDPAALAAAGGGGGYLGWAIQKSLWTAVGDLGGLFCLLLAFGGSLLLIIDRSPADLVRGAMRLWGRAAAWYRLRRLPVSGLPIAQGERPAEAFLERLEPVLRPQKAANTARPVPLEASTVRPQPVTNGPLQPRVIGSVPEWHLPSLDGILDEGKEQELSEPEIRAKVRIIEETLQHFGVPVRVVEVNQGPTVTQFGVEPGFVERKDTKGKVIGRFKVKVNRIQSLANDLALALAATSIRIEAPVPGRSMVGIEIPNEQKTVVSLRGVMESEPFRRLSSRLRIALGIDVFGQSVAADLATMPHLLIAGATGTGKSVCINAIIACLLCGNTPDELRLIMIDPKRVELTGYNGVPHLMTPVVVDIERVVGTLKWVTKEMDRRYESFARVGVRNIEGYNASAPARSEQTLPYLVVFIDELADLMMVAPDEVERSICRIAQLARATGIHLVIATQRPSVDVVTGLIKANFPARISFAVSTQIDSRVVLDAPGAEQLLGRGDMLFMASDANKLLRLQGCWVSDAELDRLANYWKGQNAAQAAALPPASSSTALQQPLWQEIAAEEANGGDALLNDAIALVREQNRASVSLLQRKLRVGYARAARIMDLLEARGIVGPAEGPSHTREVLLEDDEGAGAESIEFEYGENGE